MNKFSERITKLLKETGTKKAEFARKMYVTPQTVSRWCNGHIIPDNGTLQQIANYFNVDFRYVKGDSDNPHLSEECERWDQKFSNMEKESRIYESMLNHIFLLTGDTLEDTMETDALIQEIDDFIIFKYNRYKERKEPQ